MPAGSVPLPGRGPERRTSRRRSLALVGFALVVLVGAGLLVLPLIRGPAPVPAERGARPPGAGGGDGPSDRARYASVLTRWTDERDPALSELAADELRRFGELAAAEAEWRMTRIVRDGFEFDSTLAIDYRRQDDRARLGLTVRRGGAEVVRYRVDAERDGAMRVEMAEPGSEDYQPVDFASEAPVSLGDVRVQDLVDLYRALDEDRIRPAGSLAIGGSVDLAVFEIDLAGPAETEAAGPVPLEGASALLYCEAYDLTPRTLRVFDAEGRLVRTYTGVAFEPAAAGGTGAGDLADLRLAGFRVESPPLGSSTTARLVALEVDPGNVEGTGRREGSVE